MSETKLRTHTKLQANYSFWYFSVYVLKTADEETKRYELIGSKHVVDGSNTRSISLENMSLASFGACHPE
jgi:hypothetical protein